MFRTLMISAAVTIALGGADSAETFEVRMLNKGHNAESDKDMIPQGATSFAGKITKRSMLRSKSLGFMASNASRIGT